MTRKRFCKLVMSKSYSRNYAEGMVETFLEEVRVSRNVDYLNDLRVTKYRIIGNTYERLWKFFMAAHSQEIDPWLALLGPVSDAFMILARDNAKSLEEAMNRSFAQLNEPFKDFFTKFKNDPWEKDREEPEEGADKENETK